MSSPIQSQAALIPEDDLLLDIKDLFVFYDQSIILRGIDLSIPRTKVVSLMGRNGVGKTTTLKAIMGLATHNSSAMTFEGKEIQRLSTVLRARLGIAYVPQGRDIFPNLTVWENLKIGIIVYGKKAEAQRDRVLELFPVLKEMLKRKGGMLSGGQQQQLAIARALLTGPKLLILDEPTEGIQPSIIDQIEDTIIRLKNEGQIGILLVEQYLDFVQSVSDYFYVMDRGTIVASGAISGLSKEVVSQYLTV
jgi:urea transport system ATP-binding protein